MATPAVIDAESTLTDRYQTTVPDPVRRALKLGKGDRVRYRILKPGEVVMQRAESQADGDDPALGSFLSFLANDIAKRHRLESIDPTLVKRAKALVARAKLNLDEALSPDDE
jgi:antitoxin PrlF